ncbi:hypothetical protein GLOIN_2v1765605 [Rhizophagus clarus]|uniref:Uncharacterized protein n=1 Tax=Rhizophagus clarus TaxID=94130 RepID=A0A8H3QGN8_9GLOM|nr:hypothetical protein GLOIN_2v1765605 [Rhizophagus clarus]
MKNFSGLKSFKIIKEALGSKKLIGYFAIWNQVFKCINNPQLWNNVSFLWCHYSTPKFDILKHKSTRFGNVKKNNDSSPNSHTTKYSTKFTGNSRFHNQNKKVTLARTLAIIVGHDKYLLLIVAINIIWLVKTFGPKADPVKYKPLSQKIQIPNTLILLIVHVGLRTFISSLNYSCELMMMLFQKKQVSNPVNYEESYERLKQPAPVIVSAQDVLTQQVDDMQIEDQQYFIPSGPVSFSSGKSSIVTFFEKFEDVEACRKTSFNFNYNDQDYSYLWCKASTIASKVFTNNSKSFSRSSTKLSKKDKKTVPSKTRPTKSNKSAKDPKKTSKKLKDKKKSFNKKPQDKMDIVKLLLQLLI